MSATTLEETRSESDCCTLSPFTGASLPAQLKTVGVYATRYGLVLVLMWIGAMKFTAYEAEGISAFVANSPLMSWTYHVLSTRQFSALLGVVELVIAMLIAARPFSAQVSALGSVLAAGTFLTTISFLLSTPGVFEPSLGFPALAVLPGQFLIKDLVLFGASLWTAGEALQTQSTCHVSWTR